MGWLVDFYLMRSVCCIIIGFFLCSFYCVGEEGVWMVVGSIDRCQGGSVYQQMLGPRKHNLAKRKSPSKH